MRSHRAIVGSVLAALFLAGSLTAPARGGTAGHHPHTTSANALSTWNEIAVTTLVGLPPTAGGAPSAAPIHVAMVQGAVYDAVNAIGPRHYQPYLLKKRFSARASKDAAVATAAHAVLADIVATVPNIMDAARATLAGVAGHAVRGLPRRDPGRRSKAKGIAAGNAAAEAMIAARRDDGRFGPSQWVPNKAPGHWWPLNDPVTGQPVLDPTPWVGGVKPFLLKTSSQFRTRGPKALTSAAWARDFNEVKAIGAVDSTVRTASRPTSPVGGRARRSRAGTPWRGSSSPVRAWTSPPPPGCFAMQNLSTADASINCWNDKYHWDFWRPWNAIPRAAEDGNPATEPQASWKPLISAPYPEHPSGHLCLDGASTRVLRAFFGNRRDGYEITSASTFLQPTDERTRSFSSFSRAVAEIVEARIWAGLHYRTADLQGKALGQKVADYAADHYFQPVGHTSLSGTRVRRPSPRSHRRASRSSSRSEVSRDSDRPTGFPQRRRLRSLDRPRDRPATEALVKRAGDSWRARHGLD